MPIISFANTKGGAGKTTVTVILASELAKQGYKVTLLDCDPQQWVSRWHSLTTPIKNLTLITDVTDENIETHIKAARKRGGYTIIDLPGKRTPLLAKAIGHSNHVVVPVQGCAMDAIGGAQILELMQNLARKCDIHIDHSVVLTRVSPIITTRSMQAVKILLAEKKVRVLDTPLIERAAYRDIFVSGGLLHNLDNERVSNLDKAIDNAAALMREIVALVPLKASVTTTKTVAQPKTQRKAA